MITEAFITLIFVFIYSLTAPFRVLGDVDLTGTFGDTAANVSMILATFDFLFPVNFVIGLLSLWVLYEGAHLTWKGVNWIIRKIPTVS